MQTNSYLKTLLLAVQHVLAMFGSTILAPILMGFDPNLCILMSGIGTVLFFIITKGKVPSYLGSSFAFIGGVITATGYNGQGVNPNISIALGGIIACGILYSLVGILFLIFNEALLKMIQKLMPSVVTGAIVATIGLNLAQVATKGAMGKSLFETLMAIFTIFSVSLVAIYGKGFLQKLSILVGLLVSSLVYYIFTNILGFGAAIDFSKASNANLFGFPNFVHPQFNLNAIMLLAPIFIILVAENLGHIKAVSSMTSINLDKYLGRAFLADGISTVFSGVMGGTGVTTYAENIGVMAITKVFNSTIFLIAGFIAILLGFSPKFGAIISLIPSPVLSGVSVIVFGLIAISGFKIWVDNKIDFSEPQNLIIAGVVIIFGAGDFTINIMDFSLNGIGTATFAAIFLNLLFRR